MARVEWHGWLAVELPEGWEWDESDQGLVLTLFDPEEGVGALQISGHPAPSQGSPQDRVWQVLQSFVASSRGKNVVMQSALIDNVWAGHCAFTGPDSFWEAWYLEAEGGNAFITYNCDLEDMGKEKATYAQILDSAEIAWAIDPHVIRSFMARAGHAGQPH